MALDAANVRVAKTGAVYIAPLGTTLPTSAGGALDSAFTDLGYVSEEGANFTPSETVTKMRAWQNNAIVRSLFTETEYTFGFVLIEDKGAVAKWWYRADSIAVAGSGEWTLTPDSASTGVFSMVVDAVDGSKLKRFVVARAEITERGEQVFSNADAVGYNATVTCYYDSTLGAPFKPYVADSAWGYS